MFQDLFVLFTLRGKRGGFFVEFGATNGIELSNTCMLEKHFGWARWPPTALPDRDHRCVWCPPNGVRLVQRATSPGRSCPPSMPSRDRITIHRCVVTVEHNQIEPRCSEIFKSLSAHGYERRMAALFQFDDWYVKA